MSLTRRSANFSDFTCWNSWMITRPGVTCEGVTVLVSGLSAFATVRKSSAIVGTFEESVGGQQRLLHLESEAHNALR